jgi:nucleotide-binding universal stress UspA family protein
MKIEIRRILCPVDFSRNAAYATRYAVVFADAYDADLVLLQVTHAPAVVISNGGGYSHCELDLDNTIVPGLAEEDDDRLTRLAEDLRERHPCHIEAMHVTGKPFLEIVRAAQEEDIDLIVMGTHGRTGLRHMLIGSTAEKVVRMAPCPVLTVKHPEHEFVMP